MGSKSRNSVIDFVEVPWGTNFCKFYRTKADLTDLLVPVSKHVWGKMNCAYCHQIRGNAWGTINERSRRYPEKA